jgi:hypothetical protein
LSPFIKGSHEFLIENGVRDEDILVVIASSPEYNVTRGQINKMKEMKKAAKRGRSKTQSPTKGPASSHNSAAGEADEVEMDEEEEEVQEPISKVAALGKLMERRNNNVRSKRRAQEDPGKKTDIERERAEHQ